MKKHVRLRTAAIFSAFIGVSLAAGDELPAFKQGMWAYSSTIAQGKSEPRVRTVRRCTNPSEDIRKKWQLLAAQACQFSPVKHDGKRYSYGSTCHQNGIALRMTTVISVDNDSSYQVETESRTNEAAQKEVLVARRVGDCAK